MSLMRQAEGGYAFIPLSGQSPYSGGVIALSGFEIVHATLRRPVSWRQGLGLVERHLAALGRPRTALCAIELRCAKPYRPQDWLSPESFNHEYQALLRDCGLFVDGENPVARTNVAPAIDPPDEQALHAFSYTVPADASRHPTFVVAGSAEKPDVRAGETSTEALRDKTRDVMARIALRLSGLERTWAETTTVGVYTVHAVESILVDEILKPIGPASRDGLHWYYTRPPIEGREIEIDARGVRTELRLENI